jgi:hypothetical protein
MSEAIQHHRALGVHPGAFVQPNEPDTSDAQDGVLWVDTSTGPPHVLKMWVQLTDSWVEVGRGVPRLQPGSVLYVEDGALTWLQPADEGHTLTLHEDGGVLVPRWTEGCCAEPEPFSKPGGNSPAELPEQPGSRFLGEEVLCGAATGMGSALSATYANVARVLNVIAAQAIALAIAALAAALAEAIAAGIGAEAVGASWLTIPRLLKLAGYVISIFTGSFFASLTFEQDTALIRAAWCALEHGTDHILVDKATVEAWKDNLATTGTSFDQGQLPILGYILDIVPPHVWQQKAHLGAQTPSTACALWSCTGGSLSGGATYGADIYRSLSGGALYKLSLQNSLSGGAVIS